MRDYPTGPTTGATGFLGVSHLLQAAKTVTRPPAQSTKSLQQFLRNKGYAISVDGIRGPQTEAAVAAYHQGITARAWNARHPQAGSSAKGRTVAPAPVRGRSGKGPTGPAKYTQIGAGGNPIAAANAATASTPLGGPLTAEQRAQAQVATEFDPQIAAINQQIASARSAGAQQVANLGQWYGDVGKSAQAIGAQTAAADQGLIAGQNQAEQNMLQLFGGPEANGAAGEAAAFASINDAALAQNASANQSYTGNLVPIIATQGTEAKAAAQQDTNQQLSDLAAGLSSLQGQRGASYTKYLSDIQQSDLENQRAEQALNLAKSLAPSQIKSAKAQAAKDAFEAKQAPIIAKREAKSFGMTVGRYNSELAATKARTAKIKADMAANAKKTANGGIDWNDPNTRSSLFDQLRPIVQTKNGTWRMHPGAAQKNLNLALQTLGLGDNPQAREIANQLLQQTVTNSHAGKMWGQFNYANGKIVKTGKRFKPKK